MENRFLKGNLKKLVPYTPGEQPRDKKYIKLNTNESPYSPSPKVLEAIRAAASGDLRLYPDPATSSLKLAIGKFYSLSEQQVFTGNGSDEILALAFMAFMGNGKQALFPDISYSFYPVYTDIFEIPHRIIPLSEDFSQSSEDFMCENGGVVICNPNAPTGRCMTVDEIRRILDYNVNSVVIVDEAYIDFGGETVVPLIKEYPNLLVVQTMSKSRQLAGLRIGFAMGNEELIQGLETVKNSFNSYTLDRLAIAGGCAAMEDREYFEETRLKTIRTREWTSEKLKKLGFNVIPSKANFIFACHPEVSGEKIYNFLREKGVLVRYFKKPRIDNYIRISIGTPEEMQIFAQILEQGLILGFSMGSK